MSLPAIAAAPALEGFEWLTASIRIFRSQWLRYTSISALFLLIFLAAAVPTGGILAVVLKPVLTVGFLAAAWHHERGELPETRHLFAGFKSNLRALLMLGSLVALCGLLAFSLSMMAAGLTPEQAAAAASADGPLKLNEEQQARFMIAAIVLTLPVTAAMWFAPALIVFSDATFAQALSLSFRAFVRNLLPMICYFVGAVLLVIAIAALASPILFLLKPAAPFLAMMVAMPLLAVFMISDYVCYRRVFHRNEQIERVA